MSNKKDKKLEVDPDLLYIIQNSITVGVNEGVKRAVIGIEKDKEEKKKHKVDMRIRNTELLLHNYNNFKKHMKESVYTENQLTKEELFNELDLDMDEEITTTQINSIIQSKNKTIIIMKHIDTFLDYYKYKCLNSNREDVQRRYEVIKLLYLNKEEDKKTQEEVSGILDCSDRTVRTTKNIAIKELSVLFFGIDGLKIK